MYDTLSDQYLTDLSVIVTFYNNRAYELGDDIYGYNSNITVGNNATITFDCLNGCNGGGSSAVYAKHYSNFTFQGNSITMFKSYFAINNGGAMYITDYCIVTFKGNSTVTFNNNKSNHNGGVMYVTEYSTVLFKGNSTALFDGNSANDGGAMYISINSNVAFEETSTVTFHFNKGNHNGGAMYITDNSIIFLKDTLQHCLIIIQLIMKVAQCIFLLVLMS